MQEIQNIKFYKVSTKTISGNSICKQWSFIKINNDSKSIALACGSHSGSKLHAREAFKILWEYDIDINNLKCPKSKTSPLEHNCSGKHAAFLATCKKMNWPLDSYLKGDHPLQSKYSESFLNYLKYRYLK